MVFSFVILALTSSVAFAAPQDGIFSRASDKKAETTEKATEEKAESTGTTTVVKESSAKISQQTDGWFTVVDDNSMVEVRLPSKPVYKEVTFSPLNGRKSLVNRIHQSLSSDKQMIVDYSWWDMHETPTGRKQINEALDGAVKGSVVNVFGELSQMNPIKSGKVPGREFDFKFTLTAPNGKTSMMSGKSRIFIKENRRYQVTAISYAGKEDDDLTTKLFDSLIIKSK